MKITGVRIKKIDGTSRLKAVASITLDEEFAIHELRVIEGDNGLVVAMPSRKIGEEGFKDIAHPINAKARMLVEEAVLKAYHESLE